jgi:hypothetical protein
MKNKRKQLETEGLPTVRELIDRWMTPGTALEYTEEPIVFNSKLSPVKFLQVTVRSTEADSQAILHKLHSLTRSA